MRLLIARDKGLACHTIPAMNSNGMVAAGRHNNDDAVSTIFGDVAKAARWLDSH